MCVLNVNGLVKLIINRLGNGAFVVKWIALKSISVNFLYWPIVKYYVMSVNVAYR